MLWQEKEERSLHTQSAYLFYRIFNHKKEFFDYNSDTDFTLSQIDKFSPGDKQGYLDFIKTTKAIFQKGFVELADKPFTNFSDMMKIVPDMIKLKSHKTVYQYASKFIKNEFLRECFYFHPLLVGGNPFDTTSIYALIHYLEREWNSLRNGRGTGTIVKGLVRFFEELGGKIHYNTEIKEINIKDKKVTGITLNDKTFIPADSVVSNADVAFTYRSMIDEKYRSKYSNRKIENMRYSMSLFVIYFGTKKRYNNDEILRTITSYWVPGIKSC